MSTATLTTAQDLLRLPRSQRCELIRGELQTMAPAGAEHGIIVVELTRLLANHVKAQSLGRIFGAETGFLLARNPDTVRAADISFVAAARIPAELPKGYWPGAPDLAVEIVSPGDRMKEIDEKIEDYLRAGARLVWIVNPRNQTVTIYRPAAPPRIRYAAEMLEGEDIVMGFACTVREIFA